MSAVSTMLELVVSFNGNGKGKGKGNGRQRMKIQGSAPQGFQVRRMKRGRDYYGPPKGALSTASRSDRVDKTCPIFYPAILCLGRRRKRTYTHKAPYYAV